MVVEAVFYVTRTNSSNGTEAPCQVVCCSFRGDVEYEVGALFLWLLVAI